MLTYIYFIFRLHENFSSIHFIDNNVSGQSNKFFLCVSLVCETQTKSEINSVSCSVLTLKLEREKKEE